MFIHFFFCYTLGLYKKAIFPLSILLFIRFSHWFAKSILPSASTLRHFNCQICHDVVFVLIGPIQPDINVVFPFTHVKENNMKSIYYAAHTVLKAQIPNMMCSLALVCCTVCSIFLFCVTLKKKSLSQSGRSLGVRGGKKHHHHHHGGQGYLLALTAKHLS